MCVLAILVCATHVRTCFSLKVTVKLKANHLTQVIICLIWVVNGVCTCGSEECGTICGSHILSAVGNKVCVCVCCQWLVFVCMCQMCVSKPPWFISCWLGSIHAPVRQDERTFHTVRTIKPLTLFLGPIAAISSSFLLLFNRLSDKIPQHFF